MTGPGRSRATTALVLAPLLALSWVSVPQSARAAGGSGTCGSSAIVAVNRSDSSLRRWVDPTALTAGGFGAGRVVGSSWSSARLLAADQTNGLLFAVFSDGQMKAYTWDAANGRYQGGQAIGHGWADATQLLPQGNGALYVVFADGSMKLYIYSATTGSWVNGTGTVIGQGWSGYGPLASGGGGVVYAVEKATGALYWYKRNSFASATGSWAPRRQISSSRAWNQFNAIVGAGDGILYATMPSGALYWYNHLGSQTGADSWGAGSSTLIGSGWSSYRALTSGPDACVPAGGTASAPAPNPYPVEHRSGANLTRRAAYVAEQIENRWPSVACWGYDTADQGSDHHTGNAIDCPPGVIGRYPTPAEKAVGDAVAAWTVRYAADLKVQYVIWDGRIWNISRAAEGWRTYTGGSGVTGGHYDHVHVSVQN